MQAYTVSSNNYINVDFRSRDIRDLGYAVVAAITVIVLVIAVLRFVRSIIERKPNA